MPRNSRLPVVGVFTKQLDNWQSGSGHHLNEIMQRVLDLNDADPRFHFVFIHYKPSENPIYHRVEELLIPRNPWAATRILRTRKFDILHYTPLTVFAPIWGIRSKKVATIHGAEQLIVPQFYGTIEMIHERFLVPIYARKMDHIITVSHTSRGFFMGRYRVTGDRITVCPNAVSPLYRVLPGRPLTEDVGQLLVATSQGIEPSNPFPSETDSKHSPELQDAQAQSLLARFGLSPGVPFLFHLSRFSERKNPWTILEGFRRFLQLPSPHRFPPPSTFKLVIGGSRWDNPEVDRFLNQAGIVDRVIRTGFLKEEEAVVFYNYAAAFLFPSLAEGFGMPNLEAMACGCPVITSNVFAIPEVVGDAAIVLTSPLDSDSLAEAIQRVVYDSNLRKRLIEGGFERVRMFDWDVSARRVMEVYERLVKW
ncbi:MAG: glycosyltransferase family 4 protein [Spirochaetes bacterium]|nr:glycosyltransferase family 4 protein [Spirochaetota bacterium]